MGLNFLSLEMYTRQAGLALALALVVLHRSIYHVNNNMTFDVLFTRYMSTVQDFALVSFPYYIFDIYTTFSTKSNYYMGLIVHKSSKLTLPCDFSKNIVHYLKKKQKHVHFFF